MPMGDSRGIYSAAMFAIRHLVSEQPAYSSAIVSNPRRLAVQKRRQSPKRERDVRLSSIAALLVLTVLPTALARAQGDVGNAPNRGCSYDACALRLEGAHLVRGLRGERVGRIGLFRFTRIEPLIAVPSDSAIAYARLFDREYRTGTLMFWTGVIVPQVALAFLLKRHEQNSRFEPVDGVLTGLAFGGIAVEYVALKKMSRAGRALGRAIWWNNRDLAR